MVNPQHRCVFVGNIPYDATEEQLVQICEEVGPVVSFRLVIDRDTGKPKGYGFCEYKDEETALSARRNLQGYEINGRQLRVDFAENDRSAERNREQGRGGPGLTSSVDVQKSAGGTGAPHGDPFLQQPIGMQLAVSAASLLASSLCNAQGSRPSINALSSQFALGHDQLTIYLSKISRSHLYDILSELKTLAERNKPLIRQLLLECPQLSKALFQVQIMLGMVTPQVLQMSNVRQLFSSSSHDDKHSGHPSQISRMLHPPGGSSPNIMLSQPLSVQQPFHIQPTYPQSSLLPKYQVPVEVSQGSYAQHQQLVAAFPGGLDSTLATVSTEGEQNSQKGAPLLPPSLVAEASSMKPDLSVSAAMPSLPQSAFQPAPATSSALLGRVESLQRDGISSKQVSYDGIGTAGGDGVGLTSHPSKLMRLEDGSSGTCLMSSGAAISGSTQGSGTTSISTSQIVTSDGVQQSGKQVPQLQLLPEEEAALLQQVMSLSAEQLKSLTPEQRQQVLQLQQMLRT